RLLDPGPRLDEVGEAQVPVAALTREREAQPLGSGLAARPAVGRADAGQPGAVVRDDDVVALGPHGEVPVDDRRVHDALGADALVPGVEPRAALGLDELLVRRPVVATARLEAPLAHERRALVEERRVLGELDALDEARAPERGSGYRVVGRDVGPCGQVLD